MKKIARHFLCCFLAFVFSFLSVGAYAWSAENEENHAIQSIADLNGKRLGILAGTMLDEAANGALDYTHFTYFDDTDAEIAALIAGEIDAIIDDEPVVRLLASQNPRLKQLPESLQYDDYGFAVAPKNVALYDEVNPLVEDFLRDGTVEELIHKWVEGTDADRVMPEIRDRGDQPVLRFGVSSVSPPFAYPGAGEKVIGLDIELMGLIAERLGYRLEVVDMDFAKLLPSVLDGSVDIIGSCLSITENRKRIIRFTTGYYTGGVAVLVLNPDYVPQADGE